MSLGITEEIIARQSPEAQAIIRLLLAEIVKLEARIKELEGGRKTPQNSSLPPSSVHPHVKPALSGIDGEDRKPSDGGGAAVL
jgi:transposase